MKTCDTCGHRNDDQSNFCDSCGGKFHVAAISQPSEYDGHFKNMVIDGSTPLMVSYAIIGVGILTMIYGYAQANDSTIMGTASGIPKLIVGFAVINSGIMVWVGGYIASAIAAARRV